MNPVIVEADMVTPYGRGLAACWDGLLSGASAIRPTERFGAARFLSDKAALVPNVESGDGSRVRGLLKPLLQGLRPVTPSDTAVLLATTTAEMDLLERNILTGSPEADASRPQHLLTAVGDMLGAEGPSEVVSSACISSAAAVARAADMIRTGRREAAVVVGCDAVSEFVFAGFSTLMALSPDAARPFDRDRDGLTLGEAAVAALIMNSERAKRESRRILAEVLGSGLSCDANHMTGPSRDGAGLARAIGLALDSAGLSRDQVALVNAHGTGTVYNDAMEMKAFRTVFGDRVVPTYSIKGGVGHTMGAAGLLEILVTAESLRQGVAPASLGLREPDEDAAGWVVEEATEMPGACIGLSVNSGFGGVNSAVVLGKAS
jgi:3-oxoacyl-[acyl-carrier-protein] synthase II